MRVDVAPVEGTHRCAGNPGAVRARQRQITHVGEHEVGRNLAQLACLIGYPQPPVAVQLLIGFSAVIDFYVQCRGHQHADVATLAQVFKRRRDPLPEPCKRHLALNSEPCFRGECVQCIEHRCGLRRMAESVRSDANQQMRLLISGHDRLESHNYAKNLGSE